MGAIRALAVEVADRLTGPQTLALEAVCHRMQGSDDLLAEVASTVRDLEARGRESTL